MRLRPISGSLGKSRRILPALLFLALAFAVTLSVAPGWHDSLHQLDTRGNHQCAATLIATGSVLHSAGEPPAAPPVPAPSAASFHAQPAPRILAELAFSLLEHAPPARR